MPKQLLCPRGSARHGGGCRLRLLPRYCWTSTLLVMQYRTRSLEVTPAMDGEDTARSVALQEMKEVWGGGLGTAMQTDPDAQKRPSEPEKEEGRPDKWRKAANKDNRERAICGDPGEAGSGPEDPGESHSSLGRGREPLPSRLQLHALRGQCERGPDTTGLEGGCGEVAGGLHQRPRDHVVEGGALLRAAPEAEGSCGHSPDGRRGSGSPPASRVARRRSQRTPSLVALFSLGSQDATTSRLGARAPPAGQADEMPGCAGERLLQPHDPVALPVDTQARSGDASRSGAVHAVPQPSRGHGHGMPRGPVSAGIQRRLEDAWASATPRASATIQGGTGADRCLPERSLHRLDTAAAAELDEAGGLGREPEPELRHAALPNAQVRLVLPVVATPQQALPAKLQNPHAVCYINSCAQAWQGGSRVVLVAYCSGQIDKAFPQHKACLAELGFQLP